MRTGHRFTETCCRHPATAEIGPPESCPATTPSGETPQRARLRRPPPVPGCDPDGPDVA